MTEGFSCFLLTGKPQRGNMNLLSLRFLLLLLFTYESCRCVAAVTDPRDVSTLTALQQAWGPRTLPWTGDPCSSNWLGVSCDVDTNTHVVSLILSSMQLTGSIPPRIGDLVNLQKLDLSFNNLTGPLPKELGNLRSLQTLILQSCSFTGSIPPELGNLRNLTFLALNDNFLTGSIPQSIGYLIQLYWLDLAFNQLSGPLPVSTSGDPVAVGLDTLMKAHHFHLNNNSLTGKIPPEIFKSNMALVHLLLNSNKFTGSLPDEMGELSNIDIMNLGNNQLSGTIPPTISDLVTLTELNLANNDFTGSLPDLSNLGKLEILDLSNNGFDSSPVPTWFSLCQNLRSLAMENGNLSGVVPPDIFGLPQLQTVNFDHNFITGNLVLQNVGQQLEVVSLQYNDIDTASLGSFKKALLLEGNPGCKTKSLPQSVCSSSALTSWNPPSSTCSTCPPGLLPNPTLCSCADPFRGYILFRDPKFSIISDSQVQALVSALDNALNLSSSQVHITGAVFDMIGALTIDVAFFPNHDVQWGQSDIQRISSLLSDGATGPNYPDEFGPPLFVPFPYAFLADRKVVGLSKGREIGISVGVVTLLVLLVGVCTYAALQKYKADKATEQSKPFASWGASGGETGGAPQLKGARWFSYTELRRAADNFSERNEIGMGGYGKVYKGVLLSGEKVAIKRAMEGSMQGATEFKNEIELLSRVHHKNLVGLVGFCFEQGEQMLVYEYMPNGTLRDNLLGRTAVKMDWQMRLIIAIGSARGIAYLHELANPPIIHRDIKSSNILLDEKNIAKVADFGLSKVGPDEETGKGHVSTQVKGTLGYLDPEYYMTQRLTEKSDVYSFGVVLLELITARQPITRGKYIVREVRTALDNGGLTSLQHLLDPQLQDYPQAEFKRFLEVALCCVEELSEHRPTMNEVVRELESLTGHTYPESGSIPIDVKKSVADPYCADSEFMHRNGTDPSFHYSGAYVSPVTVEPK